MDRADKIVVCEWKVSCFLWSHQQYVSCKVRKSVTKISYGINLNPDEHRRLFAGTKKLKQAGNVVQYYCRSIKVDISYYTKNITVRGYWGVLFNNVLHH